MRVSDVQEIVVNGHALGLGGYLEIGLYDTMIDLGLGLIGAVLFVPLGVHYIKHRGKSKIVACIIPVFHSKHRS